MRSMSLSYITLRRSFAVLLPISILWLSIACISICIKESIEHDQTSAVQSSELRGEPGCEGCPLGSVPKATIPQRSDLHFDFQLQFSASPIVYATYSSVEDYRR